MRFSGKILFIFAVFLFMAGGVLAQEAALVTLRSEVLKEVEVVNEEGVKETRLVPATSAMPGEVLVFRVTYENDGAEPAENVQLTNPVPEQMVYLAGTAEGEGTSVNFSVDGGQTFGLPEALTVTGEDGKKRPAVPADYTHIRWQLEKAVPPGGEGDVSFQARLK